MDFNKTHPERKSDEVFVTNADNESYPAVGWKTKRKGHTAYSPSGQKLGKEWRGAFPVFVKQDEIRQRDPKLLVGLIP